jgi:hypothetical protein
MHASGSKNGGMDGPAWMCNMPLYWHATYCSKIERNLQTSKQTNNNVSEARGSTLEKKNASTFQGTKRKKLKEERVSK